MRIIVATGLYPPEVGGPATHTLLMEQELPRFGINVKVLPFREVRHLPKFIRHFIYFLKCLAKARHQDLIFAQDTVSVGFPAALAARLANRLFVVRVPGDYAWEQGVQRFGIKDGIDDFQHKRHVWQVELLRKIQRFVVNRADFVVTPSKYFQKLVLGWVRDPRKVKFIYNGIDLREIRNQESGIRAKKTIISVGRLVPWKGFNTLIEIMEDLTDWKLIIVGDGSGRETLEKEIRNKKLENRVILTGALSQKELKKRLLTAGVFVLNSSFESFSFQAVEAMAAGIPVVVTNIGSLPEIIDNGKSGILVEPNNKEQLVNAIKKIEQDKQLREKLSRNARKRARRFSIERSMSELFKVLKTLV